ncbi:MULTISPECIES: hypothetical protein [unclassified Salinibacterium]|uniref:hypothetical protein n=1 Tax=unclassified Salinibacterium TaxID=2632331 RepID=UPI00141F1BF9|nr:MULTISPECIES: hypothetical protein [unclassified Salinibacterium]
MKTRVSTIVWGCFILAVAAAFLVGSLADLSALNPTVLVVGAIGGIGAVLVLGGILGLILKTARPGSASAEAGPRPESRDQDRL